MYEQTLDMDKFQNYLTQHQDERFYDTFFDLASMQEFKNTHKLPGLPTPPTTPITPITPDKHVNGFHYHQINQQPHPPNSLPLQNHGMQVVPEMLPSPEEEWTWITNQANKKEDLQRNANPEVIHNGVPYDGFIGPFQQQIESMKRNYGEQFYGGNMQNMTSNFNDFDEQIRVANEQQQMAHFMGFGKMMTADKNYHQSYLNYQPTLSRATHNVLERQRRNDLKVRFSILRDSIPELIDNDKAPKIQILKKAVDYLRHLKSEEQRLLVDVELERQRKLILLQRVENLRQHFSQTSNV